MSRGWESKDVESRQEMAVADAEARARRTIETAEQGEKRTQREMLLMDKMRIERDLANARHDRHREMLRDALRHLDEKLNSLD
jgi:vacuolar-type H+-ATPase subunit H